MKKKSKEETAKEDKKKSSKKPTKEVDPDIQVLQGAGAFASAVAQVSRIGKGPKRPKKPKSEDREELNVLKSIEEQVVSEEPKPDPLPEETKEE